MSALTGNPLNGQQIFTPMQHLKVGPCKVKIARDNFEIIGHENHPYMLLVKESIFISQQKPLLNKNKTSVPLYLFTWMPWILEWFLVIVDSVYVMSNDLYNQFALDDWCEQSKRTKNNGESFKQVSFLLELCCHYNSPTLLTASFIHHIQDVMSNDL